jgi:hypothetical protein
MNTSKVFESESSSVLGSNKTLLFHKVTLTTKLGNFKKGTKFPLALLNLFSGELTLCEKGYNYHDYDHPIFPYHKFKMEINLTK